MLKGKELDRYIFDGKIDMDMIIDDYTPYLRTVIQNMVGDKLSKEDKEEIILDTFFVLWKRYKDKYHIDLLNAYLAGVAKNLVKERLKKLKYNIDISQCEYLIEFSSIDIYLQEREEIDELCNKIKDLKEIDIKIVNLFYYDSKSIKDIANELKISEMNVKTRLHRIRKKIKQELKKGDS